MTPRRSIATSTDRRRKPVEREFSAGGVVVRDGQVAVIVPRGSRALALPKGRIDPGEGAPATAVREVREETGLTADLVAKLGEARYWYRRDGKRIFKVVTFFLLRYR